MNRDMLDQLIGDPPRSTVDVGAIIAGQRRRRRVAIGAGAAGAVLAILAGAALAGGHLTARPPAPLAAPAATTASTVPSASTGPAGFALRTGTEAGRRQTLDDLRTALEQATQIYARGTAWIYMPDVPGEKRTPDGHPAMWSTTDPVSFEGRSGVTAAGHKGGFYLSVRPTACVTGRSCADVYACDGTLTGCTATRTPAGLPVVGWTEKAPASGGKQYVFHIVQITLRGGASTLTLRAVNYFGGDASPVSAPTPVLTRTQLDAIAAAIADQITG